MPRVYLAVCSCLGFDVAYLHEWIEFHRLVGVERFFLYNNGEREAQRKLLTPYVEEGLVVLHDWPGVGVQIAALQDCLESHRDDARWIAFIDTDEFLFSPDKEPVPEVLVEYESWPGLGVNQFLFGTSGHVTKPEGLVIESYLHREDFEWMRFIKSIVDPRRAVRARGAHHFSYRNGELAVDVKKRPVPIEQSEDRSDRPLRINHYYTKSEEELRIKKSRPRPDTGEPYMEYHFPEATQTQTLDETILIYVLALQEALRRASANAPRSP